MRSCDKQREAILAAASKLLSEEGPTALTVRRIAAAAGCSTMGLYSRFGGKEGVVDELFVEGFEQLGAAMAQLRETDDPVADLRTSGLLYRRLALDHATHYMVMFGGAVPGFEPTPDSVALAMTSFDRLVARLQRCIDSGAFHGDPRAMARVYWASMHGHVMLELVGMCPEVKDDPERHFEQALDVLFAGFAAGPESVQPEASMGEVSEPV